MKDYINECVGCTSMGLPCRGDSCPHRNIPVWFCDECQDQVDPSELYDVDGEDVCEECLLKRYETVERSGKYD